MADTETNNDSLVNITIRLSHNDGGPGSVLLVCKATGATQIWVAQFGDLDNPTLSDFSPMIIREDPPSNRTHIEAQAYATPLEYMAAFLLKVLAQLAQLAPLVLALGLLVLAYDIGIWAYAYHVGTASLETAVKGLLLTLLAQLGLLALLALQATLLFAWVFTPDVHREISTSTMIPQASSPDEDTTTLLNQDALAPERSSQPTDVDEADGITGEDNMGNSASAEPDISIEMMRDLHNRLTALDERFRLLNRNHRNMLRTYLDDREVDATRPLTPYATEDSTTDNAPQFISGDSSRSTSPAMETPDSTESNPASIDSFPAIIIIIDSHLNDYHQTPASLTAAQEGQLEQTQI